MVIGCLLSVRPPIEVPSNSSCSCRCPLRSDISTKSHTSEQVCILLSDMISCCFSKTTYNLRSSALSSSCSGEEPFFPQSTSAASRTKGFVKSARAPQQRHRPNSSASSCCWLYGTGSLDSCSCTADRAEPKAAALLPGCRRSSAGETRGCY